MTPVLYDYWRSSAAYRVRIALNLIGLAYTSVPIDLTKDEHRAPANLARNPQGQVPTLQIDGLTLTQSVAIITYLNDTRDAGFLPADAAGRAAVHALTFAIAMDLAPVCKLSVRNHAAVVSQGTLTADDWVRYFLAPGLQAFETMLPVVGRYCYGGSITLADIVLVPQIYNARRLGFDLSNLPRINTITATLEANPAFALAHPDRHAPD